MKIALLLILVVPIAGVLYLAAWRMLDRRAERAEMRRLWATAIAHPRRFDPSMIADLPEPAARFFGHAIRPGTPLCRVAEIRMSGKFGLGSKDTPNYLEMTARQVLAAPEGFIWTTRIGKGAMRMSGSDSGKWTRFWIAGLVPVARLGGTSDHRRSAFGRYVAEAVFWTPAALLPGPGIVWEALEGDVARVTVSHDGLEQSVDVTVDAGGRAVKVSFPRWSNANADNVYRIQTFGGYLSGYREFGGFRLPTHVEAGNFFGTEDYFPFFVVEVSDVRFSKPAGRTRS